VTKPTNKKEDTNTSRMTATFHKDSISSNISIENIDVRKNQPSPNPLHKKLFSKLDNPANTITPNAQLSPKASPKRKNSPKSPKTGTPVSSENSTSVDISMHDSDSESERCVKPPVLMDKHDSSPQHSVDARHQQEEILAEKKVKRKVCLINFFVILAVLILFVF